MKTQLFVLFLALGVWNTSAQPSNNECLNATSLTPSSSCTPYSATTAGATASNPTSGAGQSCIGTGNADDDVWFSFWATGGTQYTICVDGSSSFDAVVELSTNCSMPTYIDCADATADDGIETITYTPGGTSLLNIRVYDYGSGSGSGTFTICVSTGSGCGCSLTGQTPTLVSPGSGSAPGTTITTTTPTLTWNAVSGASNYEVYVSISPYGSANIVYQNTCVSGTSLTIPSGYLSNLNLYRWNIVGVSSCGSVCSTNVASPLYFQIQTTVCPLTGVTPTINSPGSSTAPGTTITTTTPSLSWNAVAGASNYEVYVSIAPYGPPNVVYQNTCVSGTSQSVPSGYLINGGQYRWTVVGVQSCANACSTNVASYLYFQVDLCTALSASATTVNATTPGCANGSMNLTVSGGATPYSFQWSNGYTTSNLSNISNGTYTVTVTDNNGCTITQSSYVDCVTGFKEFLSDGDNVSIFPNPTSGIFIIGTKELESELVINNVLGEKIFYQKIESGKTEIDLRNHPSGIYFLEIKTDGKRYFKKIVIQ